MSEQPANNDELSALLAAAPQNNTAVVSGVKSRIPPQATQAQVVFADLSRMNRVIEYSVPDQVIHIETGITIGALAELLSKNDQWWPVDLPDDWTLLDALNTGESGSLEHRFSSVRDLVLGCTVIDGKGGVIKCGGRVVKNVTGYDMTKLFVGSRSTLGIPVSAQLRLYAKPESSRTLRWGGIGFEPAFVAAQKLTQSGLPLSAVSLVGDSLLCRAQGMSDVVEEVMAAAAGLVGKADHENFSGEDDASIWHELTARFRRLNDTGLIALNSSASTVVKLIQSLNEACSSVECRPAHGSVRMVGASLDQISKIAAAHAAELSPVVVAGADDQYNYLIRRFPAEDPVKSRLQSSLKDQFDPHRVLNPFVLL